TAATPDEARARVRELKDRGNGCVKVFSRLPRAAYLAAADEARLLGLPVVGHVPMEVTAAEASDAGQRTIEHLDQVAVGCSALEGRLMAQLRLSAGPGSRPEDASGWRVALTAHRTHDPAKAGPAARAVGKAEVLRRPVRTHSPLPLVGPGRG